MAGGGQAWDLHLWVSVFHSSISNSCQPLTRWKEVLQLGRFAFRSSSLCPGNMQMTILSGRSDVKFFDMPNILILWKSAGLMVLEKFFEAWDSLSVAGLK